MSSIIIEKEFDQIPCQFNHRSPIQFFVLDPTKDIKATFFCQICLTMQTLPQNAKSFDQAKRKMISQKQSSLELAKLLILNQEQQLEKLAYEFDNFKTIIIQLIDQINQDIKLWGQQLQAFQVKEKQLDIELEVKSLHLNQEEYKLKELIRLEEKILSFNQSFYQKINHKIHKFFDLAQFQTCQTILDLSINKLELNNLLKEQEQCELNKTQMIEVYPNKWFLRGNFDFIQENIKYHILNWRTYHLNTSEIEVFYYDMSDSYEFLSFLFPNFYRSQYHPNSIRLNPQERNEMINDEQVSKQLIEHFQMFLFYIGVQLVENKIIIQNKHQLQKFQNIKNMQGLQRVISSLSVLNQRQNALLLVRLTKEIDFFYNDTFIFYDLLVEEGNKDEKALKFSQVKGYYVQSDIVDQQWVTFKILTNEICNL